MGGYDGARGEEGIIAHHRAWHRLGVGWVAALINTTSVLPFVLCRIRVITTNDTIAVVVSNLIAPPLPPALSPSPSLNVGSLLGPRYMDCVTWTPLHGYMDSVTTCLQALLHRDSVL